MINPIDMLQVVLKNSTTSNIVLEGNQTHDRPLLRKAEENNTLNWTGTDSAYNLEDFLSLSCSSVPPHSWA